jgi:FkbM family methyltransferase
MSIRQRAKSVCRKLFPAASFRFALRDNYWDEIELDLLDLLVDPNKCAIDVGANSGKYTIALLNLCKHVYAVEANPELARLLSRGLGKERLTILNCAASDDDDGHAILNIPTNASGYASEGLASLDRTFIGRTKRHIVPKMRLDELSDKDIGFIKMDIEGHELSALRGASKLLEKQRPTVLIECEVASEGRTTFEFLIDRGYEGFFVYSDKIYPLSRLEPFMHDRTALEFPKPRKLLHYTNNFLFFSQGVASLELMQQIASRLITACADCRSFTRT